MEEERGEEEEASSPTDAVKKEPDVSRARPAFNAHKTGTVGTDAEHTSKIKEGTDNYVGSRLVEGEIRRTTN